MPTWQLRLLSQQKHAPKAMDLASWELSGDNSTLAGTSLPGYPSQLPGQPIAAKDNAFYSSCLSSPDVWVFLKASQLLKLNDSNTPLLWFIPDTSHLHQLCSPN